MLVFAVVNADDPERGFEVFVRREDAERFVEEVRNDDPELGELLTIQPVELDA